MYLPTTWHMVKDTSKCMEGETAAYRGFTFYAYRAPGYPAFLAALYLVLGWKPHYAYLANVVFDMVAEVFVLLIGLYVLERRAAVIAQALFAVHVLWTPSLMTECLFTAVFSCLAFFCMSDMPTRSKRYALLYGVLLVVAVFVRPIALSVLPVTLYKMLKSAGPRRAAVCGTLVLVSDGNMRFMAPLYPFICLFAGYALHWIVSSLALLAARGSLIGARRRLA